LGSVRVGEFLDKLSDYQLLKMGSAVWSQSLSLVIDDLTSVGVLQTPVQCIQCCTGVLSVSANADCQSSVSQLCSPRPGSFP
jgi:hypothetical protein